MITEFDHEAAEFRKRAETAADAERLRHEVAVLTVARHPGVVQLLGCDGATLRLRLVDRSPPADLAPLAAAVATTVADLHDIGVAHGGIRAEHILVDRSGSPVLCGFGHGCTGVSPDGPEAAADVAALAEVLSAGTTDPGQRRALARRVRSARQLASRLAAPAPAGPRPTTRSGVRHAQRRRAGVRHAEPGSAEVPRAGPDRRSAPGQLRQGARHRLTSRAGLRQGARHRLTSRAGLRQGDRRPTTPGGVLHRLGRQVAARPAVRRPVLLVATMAVAVAAGAVAILAAPARVGVPAGVACPAVDQGCRPLARPGGVVEVAAGRYRVGRPGDVVVIGRWACRGPLPALLDPAAGEIWVWDGWAGLGLPAPGRPVARVAGAASMLVVPGRLGCDRLRVTLRQGGAAVIDPSPRS